MPLEDYIQAFRKLRVNTNSPHKPIMLLSVIQHFEERCILENRIEFSQDLLDTYRSLFDVVAQPTDHSNPHFPFFHLKNDGGKQPFWILVPAPGRELVLSAIKTVRSRRELEENVAHATLTRELFALLHDPIARAALKDDLLDHWFPFKRQELEAAMTQETEIQAYMRELWQRGDNPAFPVPPAASLPPEHTRDPAFSRVVRDAYDFRCAASGWRILLPDGCPMVEAAHLIPFSESHDDDPRNGIALAPTFHWALDRYLIAPGPDYKWHVHLTVSVKSALK